MKLKITRFKNIKDGTLANSSYFLMVRFFWKAIP